MLTRQHSKCYIIYARSRGWGSAAPATDEQLRMNANATGYQIDQKALSPTHGRLGNARRRVALSRPLSGGQTGQYCFETLEHVYERRSAPVGKVVDFGAGDGRFARGQHYRQYRGYEIDPGRSPQGSLPKRHPSCTSAPSPRASMMLTLTQTRFFSAGAIPSGSRPSVDDERE